MRLVRSICGMVALSGLLLLGAPVQAAPADTALLQSYLGDWRGRGVITGSEEYPVLCRLSLTQGNGGKVNFRGRCTVEGNTLSLAGTLAYVEKARRYEAVMSSNADFSGVAVGQKRGISLVFNLREREEDEDGREVAVLSRITLSPDAIAVNFDVTYLQTGENLSAEVPFTR